MKKGSVQILILLVVGMLVLTACGEQEKVDQSLEDVKEKGYFVVGLDDSFPPMGFRSQSGEIVGFDIDLAKEAAKGLGVEVKFKPVEWDGVILSLKNKDIDVIWNGLTITEDRKKSIDFSDVYLANRQAIVVGTDTDILSQSQLNGKTVGVQLGSSSEEALRSEEALTDSLKEIRQYANNVEALMDLKAGRIEAVVMDEIVARYYITEKQEDFKVLEDYLAEEDYGVGFRQEDDNFREALNKVLKEMKQDGRAETISKKWFSEDIMVR